MTEIEKLQKRFDEMGVRYFHVTLGDGPNLTAEMVATEMNKALDCLAVGDFEDVTDEED